MLSKHLDQNVRKLIDFHRVFHSVKFQLHWTIHIFEILEILAYNFPNLKQMNSITYKIEKDNFYINDVKNLEFVHVAHKLYAFQIYKHMFESFLTSLTALNPNCLWFCWSFQLIQTSHSSFCHHLVHCLKVVESLSQNHLLWILHFCSGL